MIKKVLSIILTISLVASLMTPLAAYAADEQMARAAVGTTADNPFVIQSDDAFLWDGTTIKGVKEAWYKTNVTDKGIQYVKLVIPANAVKLADQFDSGYGGDPVAYMANELVAVDFTQATGLEAIGYQAFNSNKKLTGVIDFSNTKLKTMEQAAFRETAITGVIFPQTMERIGMDDYNSTGAAAPFGDCASLAFIRVAGGDSNAVIELPSNLKVIGKTGLCLEGTGIEKNYAANPFPIKIPASVKNIQNSAINFDTVQARKCAQYNIEATDFTDTKFRDTSFFHVPYTNSIGIVLFKDINAYNNFMAKYPNNTVYGNKTYEYTLKFEGINETQTKLWGVSLQYEKDANTGVWKINEGYKLPDGPNGETNGHWELDDKTVEVNKALPATTPGTEFTLKWVKNLATPTISFTANGEGKYETGEGIGVLCSENDPIKIGVKVDHPLLKSNQGTDDDYVYFKYRWLDVKALSQGPRSLNVEPGSGFYGSSNKVAPDAAYNEITIINSDDTRMPIQGVANGIYTFYICEVFGYHVKDGKEKLFYADNTFAENYMRIYADANLKPTVPPGFGNYICVQAYDGWTITFDLAGGTPAPGVKYDAKKLKKGANKAWPTPAEPTKPGYESIGWKGSDGKTYYQGMAIEGDKDVTLTAQYEPIAYTIAYNANVEDAKGEISDQKYTYDTQDAKLTTDVYTHDTKNFLGWSLQKDAQAVDLAPGAAINDTLKAAMVQSADKKITLYGVWADKDRFTVTFDVGANGQFTDANDPLKEQQILPTKSVTGVPAITANTGYKFKGWQLNGTGDIYTNEQVQAMPVNDNMQLVAVYDIVITAKAGAGGKISPNGDVAVANGADQAFTISANSGYKLLDVIVDGVSVGKVENYTFQNVTKPHTIEVTFKKKSSGGSTNNKPSDKPDTKPDVKPDDKPGVADPKDTGVADMLETDNHHQYLHGVKAEEFGPDLKMSRAEVAAMFHNLLKEKNNPITVEFTDVPADAWYTQAVNELASLGIIKGVGENKFEPGRSISRAEFAAIATRFAKVNNSGILEFSDVSESDWFHNPVLTAVNYGWIKGYGDNTFKPQNTITRAEVTVIVNRMLDREADKDYIQQNINSFKTFIDVPSNYWAYYPILEATNAHKHQKVDHTEIWEDHQ